MKIDIRRAVKKLATLTNQLSADKVALGTARAINHTLAKGKTAASKEIRSVYNIKAVSVSKALKIQKASKATLTGELRISGSPIPITDFTAGSRHYQTKQGVSVSIFKGKRKMIKSAFVLKGKVRARGMYKEGGFEFRRKRSVKEGNDFPIPQLMTASVPQAFQSQAVITAVATKLEADLGKRLEHEFTQLISKI
jgi:hypothetical protein